MPVWFGLGGLLVWNYRRSLQDKSTLCSHGRKHLPPAVFMAGWLVLSAWLVPHFCNPNLERPLVIPEVLRRMPAKVLFGTAHGIEQWLVAEYPHAPGLRPTLLELHHARKARGKRRR